MLMLRLTHGDIWQLVSGAVRVDAVEVWTIAVYSTQDESCPNVALISEQTQTVEHSLSLELQRHKFFQI